MYHEDCLGEVKKAFEQYVKTGQVRNVELTIKRKDGGKIPVLLNVNSIKDEEGKTLYSSSCWRDISDLKETQSRLEEYAFFFKNNLDMCSIARGDGYFKMVNPKFSEILGYSQKEIYETPIIEFVHPNDLEATLKGYEVAKSGKSLFNFVNRYRKKDGSFIYLEWSCTSNVKTGDIYCIARDITERIFYEKELKTINKELEDFSSHVAHDLKAPLRSVLGYSKLILEDHGSQLNQGVIQSLNRIKINALKMGTLIDDLLGFSRLGRRKIRKTQVNINMLVRDVLNQMKIEGNANNTIEIKDLHSVYGDKSLLGNVLQNLIGNAIKFSSKKDNPQIIISSEEGENEIIFSVKDNGEGFDMKYVGKLFEVFERLHKPTDFEGTGIGLALANKIIQKHNGRIWAEGEVQKGATFYFALPKEN